MDPKIIFSVLIATGIALVFWGLDLIITGRQTALRQRMGAYAPTPESLDGGKTTAGKRPGSRDPWLATELARADLPVTPLEFITAVLLIMLLGALLGWAASSSAIGGLAGGLMGLIVPRLYVLFLQRKRSEAFNDELEAMLVLVANTLRAGHGLSQAMELVSKESAPPLSHEFERVVREISLGVSLKEALANLLRRNPSRDLELIITAIHVNHDVGGNLSEVLDRISATIRERIRLAGEVRAITSMQRLSAIVLVIMPIGLAGVLFVMNADYVSLLWRETCGLVMLGLWALLMVVGILLIRRLLAFRF